MSEKSQLLGKKSVFFSKNFFAQVRFFEKMSNFLFFEEKDRVFLFSIFFWEKIGII
jgi:hypothetical protein